MSVNRILVINPVVHPQNWCFDNERPVLEETIRHDEEQIGKYKRIIDQYEFRKETILEVLHSHGINISKLNAVCGRGDYFVQSKAEHTQ